MLATNDIFKQELSKDGCLHQMDDSEVKKMQAVVLQMAKDITGLCERYGIPYSLGGGSALGAVRHKGFIPWDDDIDINIESRFLPLLYELIEKHYGDRYVLSIPGVTKGYYSTFAMVHKKGTICREDEHTDDALAGIKIDIFPFVNTYNELYKRLIHCILCNGGSFLLSCMRMSMFRDEYLRLAGDNKKALTMIQIKSVIGLLPSLCPSLMIRFVMWIFQFCNDTGTDFVTCPSGRKHFAGELRNRRGFAKTKKMSFEDTEFNVSCDVKTYMKRMYGAGYRFLPPKSKRERHIVYELDFGE